MHVEATDRAIAIVEVAKQHRTGVLTITIGTGCCDSTAPFLYEDFWPGPGQEVVGHVAGVPVYAPEQLRANYPGADGVVIDVIEGRPAESLSIETEFDCRFILRGLRGAPRGSGFEQGATIANGSLDTVACTSPASAPAVEPTVATVATGGPSRVIGELPDSLRRVRLR